MTETIEVQGTAVPAVGFGTWELTGRDAQEGVRDALVAGYRQIDTARGYENEREVGRGIADSGVPRDEIFLTSKVPPDYAAPDRVKAVAEDSLEWLGTDRLDLFLLHWPNPDVPLEQTLGAFNELREDGRIRNLGVSNFPPALFEQAIQLAPVFCHQFEYHPFLGQDRLLELAREHGVLPTAYSPLARGRVAEDGTLREIAARHGRTPGQVTLRWLLDQGASPIPKASSPERRRENLDVFGFSLTDEDRAAIAALPKDQRGTDPSWAPDWDA
jgi:2,5-diketo-D-gluconate reductase B